MYRKKKELSLEMYLLSFLFFFFLILFNHDWIILLSIFIIYLWITYWKCLKQNKILILLSAFALLFNSFCGKIVLISKFLLLLCFAYSYQKSCSRLEYYRILRLFPIQWRKKILKVLSRIFVYHSFLLSVKDLDLELGKHKKRKGRWLLRKLLFERSKSRQEEVYCFYEIRLFLGYDKEHFLFKKKADFLFLFFHIILLGIYLFWRF